MITNQTQVDRLRLLLPGLEHCLRECLFVIDDEIEQRKHSGNDEDWRDLQRISDRSHKILRALRSAE
ncbi:hypothetical protein [Tabrizicola sp. M-4]|uniref:hypothetical protein n=1 Tax=Tabrizicola sp. M-4 TaxID=3055847 RepID=UPI003DA8F0DC